MKIYIAGFFDTRERLRPVRDKMWQMGHQVLSHWLDEVSKPEGMEEEVWWRKLALRDLVDVYASDLLIVDTLDVTPRGGREVEFGFALSRFQDQQVWVVGPYRNVFHRLADLKFDTWEECLEWLDPTPRITLTEAELLKIHDKAMAWLEQDQAND